MRKSSSQTKLPDSTGSLRCCCELEPWMCACVPSGSATPQRFIARHTNGLPGFILRLQGSALPWNNILPRTTSAECCRQQPDLLLHMHSSLQEKHTYIKPGNIAGVKCGPSTYISVFLFEIPASKSCISTILSDNLKLFWSALLISVSS